MFGCPCGFLRHRSAEVELVALEVSHRDVEVVMITDSPEHRRTGELQAGSLGLDVGHPDGDRV